MAVSPVQSSTQSNPNGFGTTVGQTSGPAIPANPTRVGLMFINPSPSVSIGICPAMVNQAALGVYTGLATGVAAVNGAGSITLQPGDKFILDNVSSTTAWNAVASGAGGVLTALEWC
jgi:hypothetical protein